MDTITTILTSLPVRFWLYGFLLSFVAGLMTGAAGLPAWTGGVAGFAVGMMCVMVVVGLRMILGVQ